ncbi:hypothetical protein [[Enterobacter] lignolyticus]|uniref:Zinc resistance-associated protein n=1 Tax=Enterobacter lignolyticus (strain SCF1) TaxID=701347 RepID=E3G2B4_ENTLS|nr:hypothetical protein [[Enterobacter] lignolyticus]ADO50331.1 hypothetical protein Entcl_4098 [[Enterobacter] lignolyticus SCF1]
MNIKTCAVNLAVSVSIILGITCTASANPQGYQNTSSEEQTAIGKIYSEYDSKILVLQQKIIAKQSELDALLDEKNEKNSEKIQQIIKETGELKAQRYTAQSEMQSKLDEAGFYPSNSKMRSGHGMMNRHNGMNSNYHGCGCPW